MARLLKRLSDNRKRSVRVMMAQKDAEISKLKERLSELYIENDKLGRENRNSELDVAYNSLKQILRNRGVCTP